MFCDFLWVDGRLQFLLVFPGLSGLGTPVSNFDRLHRLAGKGTYSSPSAESSGIAGEQTKARAFFKGSPMVWQINIILMDVSVCSTNKPWACVPHFPLPLPLCMQFLNLASWLRQS